jgi:arylsulfatase A-like enzyme
VRGFKTPNINRLAAEGINFMRMCTEPSCTPSRAALLTGRHPVRNGMYNVSFPYEYGGLAASEVTAAEVLSKAGYATAFYGKAHIGGIEASYLTNHGFDEALWTPYNQVPSLYTPQGQLSVLAPGVMYPEMFGKDPTHRCRLASRPASFSPSKARRVALYVSLAARQTMTTT